MKLDFDINYVARTKEIERISEGFRHFNNVYLYGEPGIGKTFLVQDYMKQNPLSFSETRFIEAYRLNFDFTLIDFLGFQGEGSKLLVIDGFDEILENEAKRKVATLFKEAKKNGIRILLTSRPGGVPVKIFDNAFKFKLGRLSKEDIPSSNK